jgi:hypothetical protein
LQIGSGPVSVPQAAGFLNVQADRYQDKMPAGRIARVTCLDSWYPVLPGRTLAAVSYLLY